MIALLPVERGVLVTELLGQGVNSVTGDYSRGAAGFWVENGEIQYPIQEATVAGNLPLETTTRWPVTVSYYDHDAKREQGEQTPLYARVFRLAHPRRRPPRR